MRDLDTFPRMAFNLQINYFPRYLYFALSYFHKGGLEYNSLNLPFPKLLTNHESERGAYRKFSIIKYSHWHHCTPLGRSLGTEGWDRTPALRGYVPVHGCTVCVVAGPGDASCGSGLNILTGNISDAFPVPFHHSLPHCSFFPMPLSLCSHSFEHAWM